MLCWSCAVPVFLHFFFQAEDGIRYYKVTGVQTCALPISPPRDPGAGPVRQPLVLGRRRAARVSARVGRDLPRQIGRASCRERVLRWLGAELFRWTQIRNDGGSAQSEDSREDQVRAIFACT